MTEKSDWPDSRGGGILPMESEKSTEAWSVDDFGTERPMMLSGSVEGHERGLQERVWRVRGLQSPVVESDAAFRERGTNGGRRGSCQSTAESYHIPKEERDAIAETLSLTPCT